MTKATSKIVVIVGPTASGKSDLAIKLAEKISARGGPASGWNGAEIISADSRQVYRGMDIGTGKVSKKEQKIVPHHLIDVASPKKQFTADDFKKLGRKAIDDILSRGKIPVIVGGTGFYIDVLLGRMSVAEVPPNNLLRSDLNKFTVEQLFERLRRIDPQRAKTIEPKNKRRLIRALEIAIESRKLKVEGRSKTTTYAPRSTFKILWLGINPGKEKLAERIKTRLDSRLKQGMAREITNLRKQGVSWKRLDDLGLEYRWISRFLKKTTFHPPHSTFKNSDEYQNLLRDIIKYSKRQMTWFKKNREIYWLKNHNKASRLVKAFVSRG